jgi:hypothetical protein
MLYKLHWEIANLIRAIEFPETINAWRAPHFHAYNCAVTAWHCADWAWEYPDNTSRQAIAQRFGFALSKNSKRDGDMFFGAVCKQSRDILISRQIANGSKHMKLRKFDEAVRVHNGWKTGPNALAPSILDGDIERLAHDVFEGAADYWERLFRSIGYLEDKFISAD